MVAITPQCVPTVNTGRLMNAKTIGGRELRLMGVDESADRVARQDVATGALMAYDMTRGQFVALNSGDVLAFVPERGAVLVRLREKESRAAVLLDILTGRELARVDLDRLRRDAPGLPEDFQPVRAVMDARLGPVLLTDARGTAVYIDLAAPYGLGGDDAIRPRGIQKKIAE